MLDLKELEKKLDDALANETRESLSNWLFLQRQDNLKSYLGIGSLIELKSSLAELKCSDFTYNQLLPKSDDYTCKNRKNNPSNFLLNAA
jgi:hypothetical protein